MSIELQTKYGQIDISNRGYRYCSRRRSRGLLRNYRNVFQKTI